MTDKAAQTTTQTTTANDVQTTTGAGLAGQSATEMRAQTLELRPDADIIETDEGATIYIDLPGVSHETLDIDVDHDVLTIKGGINLHTPKDLNPTYMDVHAGTFNRKFTLSAELDSEKIDANLKDGVLTLVIPRSEKHKPRKIEVKAA
jgi:HSP20 family molecular chaperone IbpA